MKIALILPNNVWFCPFASIYSKLFDKFGVKYDIISWNRSGEKEDAIQYNNKLQSRNPFKLWWAYKKFASFVKFTVKKNGYDKLIVFTPQSAIFLSDFLKKEFNGKYIFDYRDLSLEQKKYFKKPFSSVLHHSFANVISSPGFKKYLPPQYDYIISHNFDVDVVREEIDKGCVDLLKKEPIDVLTIGGIRDYESNVQIIENLANVDGFTVRFVGKGPSAETLQKTAQSLNAKNVSFDGFYPKEKEKDYVKNATFINIYYPRKASHDTALSNRFYNSLIYGKPMITTANTTQGDYASDYGVGLALENCNNLPNALTNYLNKMDIAQYIENRRKLLNDFLLDYNEWEKILRKFLEN